MKQLNNENLCIVRIFGCMSNPNGILGLVLEFCPNGDLLDYVKQIEENFEGQNDNIKIFPKIMLQICDGMVHLYLKIFDNNLHLL